MREVPRTRGWGIRLAFLAAATSGVAVFVNDLGVDRFDDATVYTTAKNGVAAALLFGLGALAAGRGAATRRGRPASPRARLGLVAVGVVGGSVPFVLFFEGLARASSGEAAFIHKTLVVWVALLAIPLLRERLTGWHLAAIALLVAGQAVLVGDLGAIGWGSGEAMILGATLLWAVEVVIAKWVLADFGSLAVGKARMGIGLLMLLGWLALTGRAGDLLSLSAGQWGWAAGTGTILSVYVATWYAALARAQAVDVTAVLVFAAVITAALSAVSDGAMPARPDLLALTLVTVGAGAAAAAGLRGRVREPA